MVADEIGTHPFEIAVGFGESMVVGCVRQRLVCRDRLHALYCSVVSFDCVPGNGDWLEEECLSGRMGQPCAGVTTSDRGGQLSVEVGFQ